MAIQDEIREDLELEVFSEFGKTVTLRVKSSPVYNTRGELEDATDVDTSIIAVPYDIIEDRRSEQPFGNLQEGDLMMAVKYDQAIEIGNLVIMETITYRVLEINKNFLPDNVVSIVKLGKVEPVVADD